MLHVSRWFLPLWICLVFQACGYSGGGAQGVLRVGSKAPGVVTNTLKDVGGDLSKMTTYRYPDKRMYRYSVHEALAAGKPIVLEFATPGHCTVCDKQLQILKALLAKYENEVLFLHMDQYQNPKAFKSFGVVGDPWTFVIDETGVVRFTRPGRMLYQEMEYAIKKVLKSKSANEQAARL